MAAEQEPEQDQEQDAGDAEADADVAADADDIGQDGCCVSEGDMRVVRDLNLDYPWKGGNQYSRVCPECHSQTFTAKSYWQMRMGSGDLDAHVVPKGDDESVVAYHCPYGQSDEFDTSCEGVVWVGKDECDSCGQEIDWEE